MTPCIVAPVPKVLVLAGFPPEGGGGGGVNLRSALTSFPGDRLFWLALQADVSISWQWRPDVPRSGVTRRLPGRRFKPIQKVWELALYRWEASEAVRLAQRIKRTWAPDCIWALLDHQTLWAVYEIVSSLQLPWHVSVQDDPATTWLLSGSRLPAEWARRFEYLYTKARSRDCISHGMARYYRDRYDVNAFMLARGIDPAEQLKARRRKLLLGPAVEIIMGGWGDCPKPWPENLIESLATLRQRLGRAVRLHAFDPALRRYESEFVIFHPRMPEGAFNALLHTMDLGYAPDPLASVHGREFAKTSLPTKLVTYLGACLPCLYHGPAESTVGEMFTRFKAGEIVDSQSPQDLADGFARLIENPDPYRDAAVQLARSDFDPQMFANRLLARF